MLGVRVQKAAFTPVVLRTRLVLSLRSYSTPVRTPRSKIWASADEAVKSVKSGDVLLCGGEPPIPVRHPALTMVDRVRACRCPRCGSSYVGNCTTYAIYPSPDTLLSALIKRKDVKNLVAVSNNAGAGDNGLGAHVIRLDMNQQSHSQLLFHRKAIQRQADRQDHRIIPRRVSSSSFPTVTTGHTLVETRPLKQCTSTAKFRWNFVLKAVS